MFCLVDTTEFQFIVAVDWKLSPGEGESKMEWMKKLQNELSHSSQTDFFWVYFCTFITDQ